MISDRIVRDAYLSSPLCPENGRELYDKWLEQKIAEAVKIALFGQAALTMTHPDLSLPELPEKCPGTLEWTPFSNGSVDSATCSSVLYFDDEELEPEVPTLCDGDQDFLMSDIPCPICAPHSFLEYRFPGDQFQMEWPDGSKLQPFQEIYFQDGNPPSPWGIHPEAGRQRIFLKVKA